MILKRRSEQGHSCPVLDPSRKVFSFITRFLADEIKIYCKHSTVLSVLGNIHFMSIFKPFTLWQKNKYNREITHAMMYSPCPPPS